MAKKRMVNRGNARPGKYAEVIGKISRRGLCPFCQKHLSKIHPYPLDKRKYWIITDNAYPYEPKREHILLIHKDHVKKIGDLSAEAWGELYSIIQELILERKMHGGTFMLRFGETKYTGATVTHLHAHLFQSNPDHPTYNKKKGVLTRVG